MIYSDLLSMILSIPMNIKKIMRIISKAVDILRYILLLVCYMQILTTQTALAFEWC